MFILNATSEHTIVKPSGLPSTTLREIHIKNGKGTNTTRIIRGKRVMSRKTKRINLAKQTRKTRGIRRG